MEFSQALSSTSDSVENDMDFVKQEIEDDDIVGVRDNHDTRAHEQCVAFAKEELIIAENFQNSAIDEVKRENADDIASTDTQDFVFVACADNVAFNETLENQNANATGRGSSVGEQKSIQKPCPYCGKNYTSLKMHTVSCELRFVYPCVFCPTVLYRRNNIKRHIQLKHSKELNGASLEEIYRDIVIKRVELNVETAAEKIKVVSEMMTNSSLRAKLNSRPVSIDRAPKFVVPNTQIQQKTSEMPTHLFAIVAGNDISQNNNVSNVIEKPSASNEQSSSVQHRKINPIDKQIESGSTKIATVKYVHCNECAYQTHNKEDLISHIRIEHSSQRKLVSFQCSKCRTSFTGRDPMIAHKANCNAKTVYSCLFCPKLLLIKARILAHIRDQHAEEVADKNPVEIATLVEAKKKFIDFSNVNLEEQLAKAKKIRYSNESSGNDVDVVDSNTQQDTNAMTPMIVEEGNTDARNRCVVATKEQHRLNDQCDRLNSQTRQCRNCDENFTCREDLIAHEVTCTMRVYFSCPFCKKIFMRKNNIGKHLSQIHFREVKDQNEVERFVEDAKRIVDTSVIEAQKESPKVTDTEKKSTKTLNTTNISTIVDTQEKSTKIIENGKESTKINGTKRKSTNTFNTENISTIVDTEMKSTKIIGSRKEGTKINGTKRKSTKTLNTENISAIVDIQKKSTKIIESGKEGTKINGTKRKITKPKVQYLFCDHCRFKTCKKVTLVGHIRKQHSEELNLMQNRKGRFNYKCIFCPQLYVDMDKVKLHVSRKHSSELLERTMDEVAQEIWSTKRNVVGSKKSDAGSFVDPDDIDASTLDHVLVYCVKCKTLKTTPGTLKARKNNCRDCGARIVYVCSKCKNSHALFYMEYRKHWRRCKEMNEISLDYLDKLVVYKCPQCQFSTTHKFKFNMHVARSKHKVVKGANGKSVNEEENEEIVNDTEVYDEDKFAVRTSVIDFSTMTNRYCPKCDKVVTEEMQPRKPTAKGLICQVCQIPFHSQCIKCNIRRSNWTSMRYHLNTKCFTGDYLCIKCPQRTTNWQAMQKHYTFRHTNRRQPYLCEYCSYRNIHRSNFKMHLRKMHPDKKDHPVFTKEDLAPRKPIDYACDLCSFTSKLKGCLKVHLHTVHSTKKHKCKLCKFKTRYAESLKRHVRTKHQNYY